VCKLFADSIEKVKKRNQTVADEVFRLKVIYFNFSRSRAVLEGVETYNVNLLNIFFLKSLKKTF
jgi:hypothetical protein